MKTRSAVIIAGLLLGMVAALAAPKGAIAMTPACTPIGNHASVDFTVGTVPQIATSGSATFKVGNKIDVLVASTDASFVTVYPNYTVTTVTGTTISKLTFTVVNNGNASQKYRLDAIVLDDGVRNGLFTGKAGTATDNANLDNIRVYVDGALSSGLTATSAMMNPTGTKTVEIIADTAGSLTNNMIAAYALKATTVNYDDTVPSEANLGKIWYDATISNLNSTETCSANIVMAKETSEDTGTDVRDGKNSARGAYKSSAAKLTISKTAYPVYDDVNCTAFAAVPTCGANPKKIPGSVIEYQIAIANAAADGGAATETATVSISDAIPTNMTFKTDGYGGTNGVAAYSASNGIYTGTDTITGRDVNGTPTADITTAKYLANGTYVSGGNVVVPNITVGAGETAYVWFRATVD